MKICIPTDDDRGAASEPSGHFGSAPYFVLADSDTRALRVVRNPECHRHHGACHHVQILKRHAVDAVACEGIGKRAFAGLRDAGIDALAPSGRTVSEILDAVHDGQARRLSVETCGGGRGHGCGGHRGHR